MSEWVAETLMKLPDQDARGGHVDLRPTEILILKSWQPSWLDKCFRLDRSVRAHHLFTISPTNDLVWPASAPHLLMSFHILDKSSMMGTIYYLQDMTSFYIYMFQDIQSTKHGKMRTSELPAATAHQGPKRTEKLNKKTTRRIKTMSKTNHWYSRCKEQMYKRL